MVSSSDAKVGALQSASTLHLAIGYRVHQHASRSHHSARIDPLLTFRSPQSGRVRTRPLDSGLFSISDSGDCHPFGVSLLRFAQVSTAPSAAA